VLFHRETGLTFSDYVMRQRIETAGNMLRYSDYSSTEISEILAFSSQSYFIRCFRKVYGMTPSEYRRKSFGKGMRTAGKAEEDSEDWRP
jgi:AraC-like DNA-binding protein